MRSPSISVWPRSGRFESLDQAVIDGGGRLVDLAEADALVWADAYRPDELEALLADDPAFSWVGLPFAGIDNFAHLIDDKRVWTAAKGVYAEPVAEHVLALALAGMRNLVAYGRTDRWDPPKGVNLLGARVTIFGAGGITDSLLRLLEPFGCDITVVRRRRDPVVGAARTMSLDDRVEAIEGADLVVLALALTPETAGLIGPAELAAMGPDAWLVNVARGGHVQTDALLDALGSIGGAALDVTDPEPLPVGHPLWEQTNVLITPHIANTPEMGVPLLADHITENVRRFGEGVSLAGVVDIAGGY